uniref:C2H2-type domain-containing protein n=1 Tax=Parastrongyloides trichosuri TaxID=131310 RepID=A0A0N4ZBV9_PARTI
MNPLTNNNRLSSRRGYTVRMSPDKRNLVIHNDGGYSKVPLDEFYESTYGYKLCNCCRKRTINSEARHRRSNADHFQTTRDNISFQKTIVSSINNNNSTKDNNSKKNGNNNTENEVIYENIEVFNRSRLGAMRVAIRKPRPFLKKSTPTVPQGYGLTNQYSPSFNPYMPMCTPIIIPSFNEDKKSQRYSKHINTAIKSSKDNDKVKRKEM